MPLDQTDIDDVAPMGSRRRAGSKLLMDGQENLLEDDGINLEPTRNAYFPFEEQFGNL
jgi:hypothetical protein